MLNQNCNRVKFYNRIYYRRIVLFIAFTFTFSVPSFSQKPKASFEVDKTEGSAPFTVKFENTSAACAKFYWDFGNGNTSTIRNPTNVYVTPGTYSVRLVAVSADMEADTMIANNLIKVEENPIADFYASNTSSCLEGNTFSFINTSRNSNIWIWDFGDGESSTLENPTHSYSVPGLYTIKLVARKERKADIKVQVQYITVYPKPEVDFAVDKTTSCDSNQIFSFKAIAPSANLWLWDFGDNKNSQDQSPDHKYNNSGKYSVSLTITDENTCSNTIRRNNYISIASKQTPIFSADTNNGCSPVKITFNSSSANAAKWFWDFGDSTTSILPKPSHTYRNKGSYTVSLTITDRNNCSYSSVVNDFITIRSSPFVNFNVSSTIGCSPMDVRFNNTSTNSKFWLWDFGDGTISTLENPKHSYTKEGSYKIKLHAYNAEGCEAISESSSPVTVNKPLANFTSTQKSGCVPLKVQFNNTSLNSTNWQWDFGDGTTSSLKNPSHTYNGLGSFDVKLIASGTSGCSDTIIFSSYIQTVNPVLNFTAPPPVSACAPFTTSFLDETPGAIGWKWHFGDNTSSVLKNPTHTYSSTGSYIVSLEITMNGGCNYFIPNFSSFNIKGGIAGFSFSQNFCSPDTVVFIDTSGNSVTWLWNFGDGETSTLQAPHHIYSYPGDYTTSLTVKSSDGCTKSILKKNNIHIDNCVQNEDDKTPPAIIINSGGPPGPPQDQTKPSDSLIASIVSPKPQSTSNSLCLPLPVVFTNPFQNAVSWLWDFGDGETSTQQNPVHIYNSEGIFDVSLVIQTDSGKTDTLLYPKFLNTSGNSADFSVQKKLFCDSMTMILTDLSANANSWLWNFGDGEFSTQQNPLHRYKNTNANLAVKLSTTNASGCTTATYKNIYAGAFNLISASSNKTCIGNIINFYCLNPDGNSFLWDFGDDSSSTSINPTHSYLKTGSYDVHLTIVDTINGCQNEYFLPYKIKIDEPIADFMIDSVDCNNPLTVRFINRSTGTGIPLSHYSLWDFGDGSTPVWSESPSHAYSLPGVYTVTLSAYTEIACVSTISKQIQVEAVKAKFSFTQDKLCLPIKTTFSDSSVSSISWSWDFGDGTTSTEQNPTHVFTNLPAGKITLLVTNKDGCTSSITSPNINFLKAKFSTSATKGCIPFNVTFKDLSSNAVSWLWDFGDGSTSSLQHPTHTYVNSGNYDVRLIVQSNEGCSDTLIFKSFIKAGTISVDFASPASSDCAPSAISFRDLSNNVSKWQWNFGDGSTSTQKNPNHIYNAPGVYTVKLIVFNDFGCRDSIIKNDFINVLGPMAKFSPSALKECPNKSIEFYNASVNAENFSWNFGDGNISTEKDPIHFYDHPGEYPVSLIVTDSIGCIAFYTTPEPVKIDSLPIASLSVKDTMGCEPFYVSFSNNSRNASIYKWDFGDGAVSFLQNPSHTYTKPGKYIISLTAFNQCGYSDSILFKTITVFPKPTVDFIASDTLGCVQTETTVSPTASTIPGTNYFWDFGNGVTSTQAKATVFFPQPGFYNVSLTMTDINGCSNTTTKTNYIYINGKTPPPTNKILTITVNSNTSINIVWEPSSIKGFSSYKLYRRNIQSGIFYPIATINNRDIVYYTDTALNTVNNIYCYKLQTIDNCGNTLDADSLEEHCSMNVSATGLDSSIRITWTPYVGCDISEYSIYRMGKGENTAQLIATLPANNLSYTDTTTFCPTFYSYRIKATGLCGNYISSLSDTAIAATLQNIFANQKVDIVRSTVIDNKSILTEWNTPKIAADKITGYNIYRSLDNQSFSLLTTVQPSELYYIDNDVEVNIQNYFYKIEALNSCGIYGMESNNSSSILLTGKIIDNQIELNWTPYKEWDTGVDYYIIEKLNKEGEWELIKKADTGTLKTQVE